MSQVAIMDIVGNNPDIPTNFVADIGNAIPIANTLEILGDTVSAGVLPVYTSASGNTVVTNVQISQAIAASDGLKIGLSAFNSADFSVDANGFVSASGTGKTITGNTGGAISPMAGNWNIITSNSSALFSGSGSTLTQNFGITNLVLGSPLSSLAGGAENVGLGNRALESIISGAANVAIGVQAGKSINTGFNNISIGYLALSSANTQSANIAIGRQALQNSQTDGCIAVGLNTLQALTSGIFNVAVGQEALQNLTTGGYNTVIGYEAAKNGITVTDSVSIGFQASINSTGDRNVTIGSQAMLGVGASTQNVMVGYQAGNAITTAASNTGIGYAPLVALTTGSFNTACGYETLFSALTGSYNTAIGYLAGSQLTTSDSSNIYIGNTGITGDNHTIRIGTQGSSAAQQNLTFVAGITGVTASSSPVGVSSTGQLSDLGFGTSAQILTSNGAAVSPTWQSPAAATKVTQYTSSDTWTKDARTKYVIVFGWNGGGSGASGRKGASTASAGGGGGAGGAGFYFSGHAGVFGSMETVTIGAPSTGANGQSSDGVNGINGAAGNNSVFGNIQGSAVSAATGGGTSSGSAGSGTAAFINYSPTQTAGSGRNGSNVSPIAATSIGSSLNTFLNGSGGGGGAGYDAVTPRTGGAGGAVLKFDASTVITAGGTGGSESGTINGGDGNIPATSGGIMSGGTGGGGGGGPSAGTTAGNGGNGKAPGGGGGGGSGGITTVANSGAGGNGGRGEIWVIEFF